MSIVDRIQQQAAQVPEHTDPGHCLTNDIKRQRRAVFIDRDGVICHNRQDHVKSWDEFIFLPGALKALKRLAHADLYIIIITNQAVINRGIVTIETVHEIHQRMLAEIHAAGGRIDQVYFCPHRPDEHCACRKPQPGMLHQAAQDFDLDLAASYLIGDAETDIQAGKAAGCQERYLVLTGRGRQQLIKCWQNGEQGFRLVSNLETAINHILNREWAQKAQQPCVGCIGERSYVYR